MKLAMIEERCPMSCCGNGVCGRNTACSCKQGWHGDACNINDAAWAVLGNLSHAKSAAMLKEAKGKREQAEKTRFLAEMLQRASSKQGSEAASVIAQVQQLNRDVVSLTKESELLEQQAKDAFGQGQDSEFGHFGNLKSSCSPAANSMTKHELLSAQQFSTKLTKTGQTPAVNTRLPSGQQAGVSEVGFSTKSKSKSPFGAQKIPPPKNEDFGIDKVNDNGATGILEAECEDNCNFRGVCKEGTCYCQPNYYGPTCGTVREKKTGTLSLGMTLMIAAGCVTCSFLATLAFLNWNESTKRSEERKLGYNV